MHKPSIDWQQALREAFRDPLELLQTLQIDPRQLDWLDTTGSNFPLRVPRSFVARMRPGDARDPLLLQVLPRQREKRRVNGFVADPLQEASFQDSPGLIQKYRGRALLITTAACGVHCRYCFRREFPYAETSRAGDGWQQALAELADSPDIEEIILSGGDPLSLSDSKLGMLLRELDTIPHLRRLRIHSRQPIVLPERVTQSLVDTLANTRLRLVFVLHSNHPNEIDLEVPTALRRLRETGALLLNQAVLLKGINDNATTLAALSERLFDEQVLPYYLHQLDPVIGAAHFQLADAAAHGIMQELNSMLPGYLVPRLVRELPGANGKLPLSWADRPAAVPEASDAPTN